MRRLNRSDARGVALAAALSVTLGAGAAQASGFGTARFTGEHGHPTTDNGTAAYFNPGALVNSTGTRLLIDGSLALRWATFEHEQPEAAPGADLSEPADAQGANYGKATLFNVFGGPSLAFSMQHDDLVWAVGLFAPFAGSGQWDENAAFDGNRAYPGAVDGVSRWHLINGTTQTVFFTGAVAYAFGDWSLGVSANLINASIHTLRARSPSGDDDLGLEGRSLVDVNGWFGSYGVGLQYSDQQTFWIGASYQAQPGLGVMKLEGKLKTYFVSDSETAVNLHQELPDSLRLGGRYRPQDDLELRLFGEFMRWSVFDNQCVALREVSNCRVNDDGSAPLGVVANFARDWQDAFQVRAGVSWWTNDDTELFFGLGFDSNAVPDATLEPALMDGNDLSAAIGARFALTDTVFLAGSYTHLYYFPRDNSGESELDTPTRTASGELTGVSAAPDAGGKYTHQVGVLNANLELRF